MTRFPLPTSALGCGGRKKLFRGGDASRRLLQDAVRRALGPLAGRLFAGSRVPPGDLLVEADAEAAFDARPVLSRVTASVLVLCGDRDRFFSREAVLQTCAAIRDCTLVWYRGKGHLRAASSRRVPQDVLAWVRRLDAAGG